MNKLKYSFIYVPSVIKNTKITSYQEQTVCSPLHKDQTMYGVIEMKDGEEFKNFFDPKIKWNAVSSLP